MVLIVEAHQVVLSSYVTPCLLGTHILTVEKLNSVQNLSIVPIRAGEQNNDPQSNLSFKSYFPGGQSMVRDIYCNMQDMTVS